MLFAAAALAVTTPVVQPVTTTPPPIVRIETKPDAKDSKDSKPAVDPFAEMAKVMQMFDKFFPPQPNPDPRRLAAAQSTAMALLPPGSYGKGMGEFMDGMATRGLALKGSDFEMFEKPKTDKAGKPVPAKPSSNLTLRQQFAAEDPHFDERYRLTRGAIMTELDKLSVVIEPKLRDGLARGVARRFNDKQLADINAFLATDSGKAMGAHFLGLWFDPEMMRSMMGTMPEMVYAAPGAMMRIAAATAHLPKPPKKAEPKAADKPAAKKGK
jgi:hypothetical protein